MIVEGVDFCYFCAVVLYEEFLHVWTFFTWLILPLLLTMLIFDCHHLQMECRIEYIFYSWCWLTFTMELLYECKTGMFVIYHKSVSDYELSAGSIQDGRQPISLPLHQNVPC